MYVKMEALVRISLIVCIAFCFVESGKEDVDHNAYLSTPSLIRKYGYPAETHTVLTQDGYLLGVHRIPHGKSGDYSQEFSRPVVFLQHGDLGSSADWVVLGPQYSLAFLLADAGYDVWMGNSRGNTYSLEHDLRPITDPKFWNFSWDQLALFDLPAELTYILSATGQKKLDFIGFSLGATTSIALIAARPEFNKKINLLVALAPTVYVTHSEIPEKIFAPWSKEITFLDKNLHKGQVFPQSMVNKKGAVCETDVKEKFCETIFYWLGGHEKLNKSLIPVVLNHFPAGSSAEVLEQISQQVETGHFSGFDHGESNNLKVYNSKKPPSYNLDNVKLPVAVFYSEADLLSTPSDIHHLIDELPFVVKKTLISGFKFHHFDFVYSQKAKPEVYDGIIKLLKIYKNHDIFKLKKFRDIDQERSEWFKFLKA